MQKNNATYRSEIVDMISGGARVLDVGCGYGDVGRALKLKNCEVTGIEYDEERCLEAAGKIDKLIKGDIETMDPGLSAEYFDFIIFADVLEHLRDPLAVLLGYKRYLKSGGSIIVSIPNVRHISVICDLLVMGKWEYKESGLLDRSHLRFFTKKSVYKLFDAAGLRVLSMDGVFSMKGSKYIDVISAGLLRDFLTAQYVCRLEKK